MFSNKANILINLLICLLWYIINYEKNNTSVYLINTQYQSANQNRFLVSVIWVRNAEAMNNISPALDPVAVSFVTGCLKNYSYTVAEREEDV